MMSDVMIRHTFICGLEFGRDEGGLILREHMMDNPHHSVIMFILRNVEGKIISSEEYLIKLDIVSPPFIKLTADKIK